MNKKVFFLTLCLVISLGVLIAVIIGSRNENQFAATMPFWRGRATSTRPSRPPQTTTPTSRPPRPTLPQHAPTVNYDMQIENNDLPLGNPNEIINDYQRIDIDRDEGARDYELSPLATIPKHVVPPFPSTTIENSPTTTVPGMPGIGFGWIYQICCMYNLPCCKK